MSMKAAGEEGEQDRVPRWQKLVAVGIYVLLAAVLVIFHSRLGADFWPPDAARVAPNILAAVVQAAVVFPIVALIWPPTRRRIHRFADAKLAGVHARLDAHHQRQEDHNAWMARLGASQHQHLTGHAPPPHPHFDLEENP